MEQPQGGQGGPRGHSSRGTGGRSGTRLREYLSAPVRRGAVADARLGLA